jgi:predicted ATPase/class 3 adenylate cyclase
LILESSSNEKLPAGTVTFLFSDIVGSTPLWESQPVGMAKALEIHNTALRSAIETHGGVVFKTVGDAFQAAFPTAPQALRAAIAGQRALQDAPWNELGELKVRMGLHTGEAVLDPDGNEYAVSHTKNRVARIMSAAHGMQILLSQVTAGLVDHQLPNGVTLKDLGEHRMKGMEIPERLYQVIAPKLSADFPPLGTESRVRHNLPLELTSFIGRQNEVTRVKELLSQSRMVTLTGSGGVGKTRLSIRVAAEMLDGFPDGVWIIELAPLSDPDRVPQTVVSTLGLRQDSNRSPLEMLGGYLDNRQVLLILDNCEHLLKACTDLADYLLRNAPSVKILASSREALGISGEVPCSVPSLTTPDLNHLPDLDAFKNFEAVRLFVERAKVAAPSFQVETHNMPAIAQICSRLDGIPLALELAAARLRMLTTAQLASRLDNAFRLLTGGSRSALQVCADEGLAGWEVFDLMASLVDKSIIKTDRARGEAMRFRILETVRQYASQKLFESGESQTFHDRHLEYYLDLAEMIEPQLRTSVAIERLSLLSLEAANLAAALSWAFDSEDPGYTKKGLRLASALLNYWHTQNFQKEGYNWLVKGLERFPEDMTSIVRAKACFSSGQVILALSRITEAQKWLEESLQIYKNLDDPKGIVTAQSLLGEIYTRQGMLDEAEEFGKASVAQCRTLNDPWLLAYVLCRYGTSLFFQNLYGESKLAFSLLEESLSIFEQVGDQLQIDNHFIMLGVMTLNLGDVFSAKEYFKKSAAVARAMNSWWTEASATFYLSRVAYAQGDFEEARILAEKSLSLEQDLGRGYGVDHTHLLRCFSELKLNQTGAAAKFFKKLLKESPNNMFPTTASLIGTARIQLYKNQHQRVVQLLGAAQPYLDLRDGWMDPRFLQKEYDDVRTKIQGLTNLSEIEQDHTDGQTMTFEAAVALALQLLDG